MAIEAVVGGVAFRPDQPASVLPRIGIKGPIPGFVPVDPACGHGPEAQGIALPGGVDLMIAARHGMSSSPCGPGPALKLCAVILPSTDANATAYLAAAVQRPLAISRTFAGSPW